MTDRSVERAAVVQLELIKKQLQEGIKACDEVIKGIRIPKNVASHLIGIAAYVDAVAQDIKLDMERDR